MMSAKPMLTCGLTRVSRSGRQGARSALTVDAVPIFTVGAAASASVRTVPASISYNTTPSE